jgi:hypothetical protein
MLIPTAAQLFSQQRQFVAWLCFTETQSEALMTDSLRVSFAS